MNSGGIWFPSIVRFGMSDALTLVWLIFELPIIIFACGVSESFRFRDYDGWSFALPQFPFLFLLRREWLEFQFLLISELPMWIAVEFFRLFGFWRYRTLAILQLSFLQFLILEFSILAVADLRGLYDLEGFRFSVMRERDKVWPSIGHWKKNWCNNGPWWRLGL